MKKILLWILFLAFTWQIALSHQQVVRRPQYSVGVALDTISGLQLWYKPETRSLSNNDPISTLTDSSGNGRDASGTTTTRPLHITSQLNGYAAIRPDGSDDKMTVSGNMSFVNSASWTAFIVVKISSNKSNNNITGGTSGTNNGEMRLGYNTTSQLFLGQYANDLAATASAQAAGEVLTFARRSGGREILQNNTSKGTDSNTDLMTIAGTFYLFRSDLTGSTFQGDVFEIVFYSPALGTTDEQNARTSLLLKYGL
jgi:hypothetical protein